MTYRYFTNCVGLGRADVEALREMIDHSRPAAYYKMRQECPELLEMEKELGYDTGTERGGLRLKDDYAVSFRRSKWKGKPCYYLVHSSIEYIFVQE